MTEPFFAVEGGEGSGKSTQLKLLNERFGELFPERKLRWTREPGGSPFAESVRNLILSEEAKDLDGRGAFYGFALARHDHIKKTIRPGLDRGEVVISDRFAAATYAYQAWAMENPISEDEFRYYYDGLEARPAVTIILDIDPVLGSERIGRALEREVNHFDLRSLAFHQKVREGYLRFDRFAPACVIDADRTKEEVFEDIVACLKPYL